MTGCGCRARRRVSCGRRSSRSVSRRRGEEHWLWGASVQRVAGKRPQPVLDLDRLFRGRPERCRVGHRIGQRDAGVAVALEQLERFAYAWVQRASGRVGRWCRSRSLPARLRRGASGYRPTAIVSPKREEQRDESDECRLDDPERFLSPLLRRDSRRPIQMPRPVAAQEGSRTTTSASSRLEREEKHCYFASLSTRFDLTSTVTNTRLLHSCRQQMMGGSAPTGRLGWLPPTPVGTPPQPRWRRCPPLTSMSLPRRPA